MPETYQWQERARQWVRENPEQARRFMQSDEFQNASDRERLRLFQNKFGDQPVSPRRDIPGAIGDVLNNPALMGVVPKGRESSPPSFPPFSWGQEEMPQDFSVTDWLRERQAASADEARRRRQRAEPLAAGERERQRRRSALLEEMRKELENIPKGESEVKRLERERRIRSDYEGRLEELENTPVEELAPPDQGEAEPASEPQEGPGIPPEMFTPTPMGPTPAQPKAEPAQKSPPQEQEGQAQGEAGLPALFEKFMGVAQQLYGDRGSTPIEPVTAPPPMTDRDRNMMLARLGFGMAAGDSPFFGRNLGKAGLMALQGEDQRYERYQEALDSARQRRLQQQRLADTRKSNELTLGANLLESYISQRNAKAEQEWDRRRKEIDFLSDIAEKRGEIHAEPALPPEMKEEALRDLDREARRGIGFIRNGVLPETMDRVAD